jgi:tetratricopeptide (TPR) repeat protein
MKLRAFVVMPFGVKPVRAATPATAHAAEVPGIDVDFDDVYEQLIGPAVSHAGAIPIRADQEPGAGDIRTDMFYELVTADIVVADISILNANVFYELGIRHGVTPRGVFMVHGGWTRRPFDIVTDRTFDYDGGLFVRGGGETEEGRKARVDAEARQLGEVLRAAFDQDRATIGSPVYKEMPGLTPVDWTDVQTARAKYFGEVFADWKARVEVARLNGWPGDILTLAEEAPTSYHAVELLCAAADALCSMERFTAALPVLKELLALAPGNLHGERLLGLVLGRLGQVAEAKVHMLQVAERHESDPEAQGILGRVYKDLWRLEWRDLPDLTERQQRARQNARYVNTAIDAYDKAARRHFDFYTAVNVVSLTRLLEHLGAVNTVHRAGSSEVADLVAVARFGARNAMARTSFQDGQEGIWAAATLGELELVTGDVSSALDCYRDAAYSPGTTYFNVRSMLDQILLFESLGFRADALGPIKEMLQQRAEAIAHTAAGARLSSAPFAKVIIASGHMIDAPNRPTARFPSHKETAVRDRIDARLAAWKVGAGDLAVCGGARGADILFAELCAARGAEVWMLIALGEADFLEKSVRLPRTDWEDRYYALQGQPNVKVVAQPDRLKAPPKGASPFSRNNVWMLNTARVEVDRPRNLYALLIWDEQATGDGPGGTSEFVERVRQLGGRREVINPTLL